MFLAFFICYYHIFDLFLFDLLCNILYFLFYIPCTVEQAKKILCLRSSQESMKLIFTEEDCQLLQINALHDIPYKVRFMNLIYNLIQSLWRLCIQSDVKWVKNTWFNHSNVTLVWFLSAIFYKTMKTAAARRQIKVKASQLHAFYP